MAKAVASLDVFNSPHVAQWRVLRRSQLMWSRVPTEDGLDMSERHVDELKTVLNLDAGNTDDLAVSSTSSFNLSFLVAFW
jgi:hypothetical protein